MTSPSRSDEAGGASPRQPDPRAGEPSNPVFDPTEELPGVPGFRTWKGVYWFVFGCFVVVVIVLTILTRVYA